MQPQRGSRITPATLPVTTMPVVKTPTSSLTAPELLISKLWYRTFAKIEQLFYGSTQEPSIAHSSPITKLPQEIVEVILSYLIYNMSSLLACSLTCYSWYIAAVPHLHHTLTINYLDGIKRSEKRKWLRPLERSYELGLLPLVKKFRIRLDNLSDMELTPAWLNQRALRSFSALTNLRELGIDNLDVPGFMPTIQQGFGYLSPTLQFLALKEPGGSRRQILYFIGLFPNLQDLKLRNLYEEEEEGEDMDDATLIPPSIPPLRGRLTLAYFGKENLVKDMIALFGGLRFRHLDLLGVDFMQLLFDACTETLETLRLYPVDEYYNPASLQSFDLSQNRSLWTLETSATIIASVEDKGDGAASRFFETVLSSITPSVPLDFVIIHWEPDFGGSLGCDQLYQAMHCQQMRLIRKMQCVRDFRLVLCADVFDCAVDYSVEVLEQIAELAEKESGHHPQKPLIISERRSHRILGSDGRLYSSLGVDYDISAL